MDDSKLNRLIWGDNLLTMQALLSQGYGGKIDLIYIDPPFLTSEDYKFEVEVQGYGGVTKLPSLIERLAYRDTWDRGVDSYLDMLHPRLQLMRRLLKDSGSIYVHVGANISHYVKVMLDEIFGRERFVNEIVWKRYGAHNDPGQGSQHFGRVHDAILYYSRGSSPAWNQEFTPLDKDYIEETYRWTEPGTGRRYTTSPLTGPGGAAKGNPVYEWKGHVRAWRYSKETMEELDRAGKIYYSKTGYPRQKQYLDSSKGVPVQDVWSDISSLSGAHTERVGFPTQKPVKLLERLITVSTQPGALIADFFAGSGTTAVASERLGRRWIECDFSKVAIQFTRARLVDENANPFVLENIGNYQRELIYKEGGNIALMQRIVMKLYGAEPHPAHTDLGILMSGSKKALAHVGYPDRPLTAKKTAELVKVARTLDGEGYDKLVLLAWDYEYNYDEGIEIRRKGFGIQIEPRLIPPSIYEYLRKSKNEDDLIEKFAKKIQFGAKPYLKITAPKVTDRGGGEHNVVVAIEKYVLSEVPVEDDNDRIELQKLSAGDGFSALIDYWAVDWDYDGKTFRSRWQDFRSDEKDGRPVTTIANTTLTESRRFDIAVRVVDVFGNDATATTSVDLR
ncbi:MAG: site-specific DNA-methyltransferase [Nitrososphaerota archaeon]|nr:site-specific DNA-methyltransferase [Nitrososphaerota archaeon]